MATQGGVAPFVSLYLVVDPADFGGVLSTPFIPDEVPSYFSLRSTPQEAIRRWSWWRRDAFERINHTLLLSYKLTSHGLGCAVLGNVLLNRVHWERDGSVSGLRLCVTTLEQTYYCEDVPTLVLENVDNVFEAFPEAHQWLSIA